MKRKIIVCLLVFSLCIFLFGCYEKSEINTNENLVYEKETAVSTITPLLYKATDRDGNVAWLFGSVHIGKSSFYPLPDYVMEAFNSSDALAVEVDSEDFDKVYNYAKFTDGSSIKDHIDAQLYDEAYKIFESNGVGERASDEYMASVWALNIDSCTYKKLGFDQSNGVDIYLLKLADENSKEVLEVEGDKLHGESLALMSDKTQQMLLQSSVSKYNNAEQAKSLINETLDMWTNGDETELANMTDYVPQFNSKEQNEMYEEYTQIMRTDRNDQMTEYIKNAMKSKEIFMCVGYTHLVGENSVVSQLKDSGYIIETVK